MWVRATRMIRGQRINLQVKIKWTKYIVYSLAEWVQLGKKDQRERHRTILISLKDINCNVWNVLVSHRLDVDSAENTLQSSGHRRKKVMLSFRKQKTYKVCSPWHQKMIWKTAKNFWFMSDLSHRLTQI